MSLPQFGYGGYSSNPTSLQTSQLLMPGSPPIASPSLAPPGSGGSSGGGGGGGTPGGGSTGTGSGASPVGSGCAGGLGLVVGGGGCCEGGRILGTNPHTGQPLCSCQAYAPSGFLSTYSRVAAGLSESVYGPSSPYTTSSYVPFGADPSAFYPPLTSTYDLKEASDSWRSINQPTACYAYDPTAMTSYPYSNAYGAMDINSAARRKNATRENTNTLKAWLYEHRKNPYPTKGEKIMLAIITKMTLTQVSTWFANARRRLKKENKMTWSPRNRSGDADDDDANNDEEDEDEEGGKVKEDDEDDDKKDDERQKDKGKDENGKADKDCAVGHCQTTDTGAAQSKRLFEDDSGSPLTAHPLGKLHSSPSSSFSSSTRPAAHGGQLAPASLHLQPPLSHPQRCPPPPPLSSSMSSLQHPLHHLPQQQHQNPLPHNHHHQQPQQQLSPHDLHVTGPSNFLGMTSNNNNNNSSLSSSQLYGGSSLSDGGLITSPLDSGGGGLGGLKRPDSLCSNSNDSGLSDVNCNFASSSSATAVDGGLDVGGGSGGFRPKIWSLAHVATASDSSPSPYLVGPGARGMGLGGGCAVGGGGMSLCRSPPDGKMMGGGLGSPPGLPGWGPPSQSTAFSCSSSSTALSSSALSSLYPGSHPRSFVGMGSVNSFNNHHHKVPNLAAPMFSHQALSGMPPGLHPHSSSSAAGGSYGQLSTFGYSQAKLTID